MKTGTLYDITPLITPGMAVWPGDTPPERDVLLDLANGDPVTLSTLRATVHLGAHADAPSHYALDGPSIEHAPLARYVGPCQIVPVAVDRGCRIRPGDLQRDVHAERVLLRTDTYPDLERFADDFAALDPTVVDFLADRGVCLIGVDTPSVDLFASKNLPAHGACRRRDMSILEGLVLRHVPVGDYELIALPLRLQGFDGSPVRAVLRTL